MSGAHYLRFHTQRGGYVSNGDAFPTLEAAQTHAASTLQQAGPGIVGATVHHRGREVARVTRDKAPQ